MKRKEINWKKFNKNYKIQLLSLVGMV